jgi:uncharacterized membrane protein
MASTLYKKRLVVASADLNQVSKLWKASVAVFWVTDTQKLHTISDIAGSFATRSKAETFASEVGKIWIDSQALLRGDVKRLH